jgi:hypothetical protein
LGAARTVDIEPVNIVTAAVITQFSILIILFLGLTIIAYGESAFRRRTRAPDFGLTIVLTFASLLTLFVVEDFARMWKPAFGHPSFSGLALNDAVSIVFVLDALCAAALVYRTRGAISSPFAAILFAIPSLAIFLRQPTPKVIAFTVLVGFLFTILIRVYDAGEVRGITLTNEILEEGCTGDLGFWVVSILTFGLTTLIGLITRP